MKKALKITHFSLSETKKTLVKFCQEKKTLLERPLFDTGRVDLQNTFTFKFLHM